LVSKMIQHKLNPYLTLWYASFLTHRIQFVKVNNTLSSAITTNVGAQLCFSLFIQMTVGLIHNTLKYSDDTALISLLSNSNNPGLHQHAVNKMVMWSDKHALKIKAKKTEEIVFGSPSDAHKAPILIHDEKIKQVSSYKYLGIMIDHLVVSNVCILSVVLSLSVVSNVCILSVVLCLSVVSNVCILSVVLC
uniref:Uncharacterized protein n=1 Tax=Labrus bergylta TaxID=56723 RepID=A0A3Q3GCF5_9LABR